MFRVLAPTIRSSYNCNYSFWHWSAGSSLVVELEDSSTCFGCWHPSSGARTNCNYSFWHWSAGSSLVVELEDSSTCFGCWHPSSGASTKCNYSFWRWSAGSSLVVELEDSSTCFGCWHPPSGAPTIVITASGTGQPGPLSLLSWKTALHVSVVDTHHLELLQM